MTSTADEPQPLPGLEAVAPSVPDDVEAGVRRTLLALYADSGFEERHAGVLALIIATARQVDRKAAMAKPSSMFFNDARLLFERLDLLMGGDQGDPTFDERVTRAMEEWAEQTRRPRIPDGSG